MTPEEAIRTANEVRERYFARLEGPLDFTRSMLSRGPFDQRAGPEVVRERHIACHGREPYSLVQLQAPCERRVEKDGFHYCGSCGCPKAKGTRLDVGPDFYSKLEYPWLACPLKRKGFSNHEPP
ncbi:MAG: hypothetical protein ACK5U7_07495 [Bacteroidota bacterium]|jgi:hypothetical protein